jgi:2'-5' RNA ligase
VTENSAEKVRLFTAIELPEKTKRELARIQGELIRICGRSPTRWVAAESMHLTLNFLGDFLLSNLGDIKSVALQVAATFGIFELTLADLGAFPNLERPRVIWVGLDGNTDRLCKIQKSLEELLAGLGFNSETRPFSPHLTLARVRDETTAVDKKKLGQAICSTICKANCSIPVCAISLVKSQLTSGGPIYTVLSSVPLGQKT